MSTPASGSADGPADLVVRNARIHTGDPGLPAAEAVAVRDGTFVAVGDERTVSSHVGPGTRVVDGLGRRVIPGLNDSHLHAIRGGRNYLAELRWDGVGSLRVALAMVREQAERTPAGQWILIAGGWSVEQFLERRLPTPAELTAVAPDTPVLALHVYQSAVLNRAAVAAAGYTSETPDPAGGQIVRDHAGRPTGMLLAAPAATILYGTLALAPPLDDDTQELSTRHFLRELNRFGITSAIDPAGGFQDYPKDYGAVLRLAERGELTVRIAYHLFPQTPGQELDDLRRWIGMVKPGDGDEWLRCNGAGENLAWSPADFENFAEPRPERPARADDELEAAARLLLGNGWGFRLHATYDETISADLGVFEKIAASGDWPSDLGWYFDHAETASPRSIERIAALGGGVSVQNRLMFQGAAFVDRYGPDAAAHAPPIQGLLDAGVPLAAGSDATRVSSYNPWLALAWLVTGRTLGGLELRPRRSRLDRDTALRLYTRNGAAMTGEQDVKGTVEVGKYADLAVLSADFFSVDDAAIGDIESLLTVAGGRIVYAAGEYEGLTAPLPPITPSWSPVAHLGGYQGGSGVSQARAVGDAARESDEHWRWRRARDPRTPDLRPFLGC